MKFHVVPLTLGGITVGTAHVRDDGIIEMLFHSEAVEGDEERTEIVNRAFEAIERGLCSGFNIAPTPTAKMFGLVDDLRTITPALNSIRRSFPTYFDRRVPLQGGIDTRDVNYSHHYFVD